MGYQNIPNNSGDSSTALGSGNFNPVENSQPIELFDDFLGVVEPSEGITSGPFMWELKTAGSVNIGKETSLVNQTRPGMLYIGQPDSGGEYGSWYANVDSFVLGASTLTYAQSIYLDRVNDDTDDIVAYFGLGDSYASFSNGVYFMYETNIFGTPKLLAVTESGGSTTETDTGVTIDVDTWYNLRFEVNQDASEIKFYVNGTLVATNTDDIPTTAEIGPVWRVAHDAGTPSGKVYSDWVFVRYQLQNDRGTF